MEDFYEAIMNNDLHAVQKILDVKDVNTYDINEGLLYSSFSDVDLQITQILLNNGADPNYGSNGETPLMIALEYENNIGKLRLLLDAGANPNYIYDKTIFSTPLMKAAEYGSLNSVRLLLEYGARTTTVNYRNNKTAYDLCSSKECQELIANVEKTRYKQIINQPQNIETKRILDRLPKELRPMMIMKIDQIKFCEKLHDTQYIGSLWAIADFLDLEYNPIFTKQQLCELIGSRLDNRSITPLRWE